MPTMEMQEPKILLQAGSVNTPIQSLDPQDCKRQVSIMHKFCLTYISQYKLTREFVSFWSVKNIVEMAYRPIVCVCMWEQARKVYLSGNPVLLLEHIWLTPSLLYDIPQNKLDRQLRQNLAQ